MAISSPHRRREALFKALRKLTDGKPRSRRELIGKVASKDRAFCVFYTKVMRRLKEAGFVDKVGERGDAKWISVSGVRLSGLLDDDDAFTAMLWPSSPPKPPIPHTMETDDLDLDTTDIPLTTIPDATDPAQRATERPSTTLREEVDEVPSQQQVDAVVPTNGQSKETEGSDRELLEAVLRLLYMVAESNARLVELVSSFEDRVTTAVEEKLKELL